jgi:hypothetical protein
VAPEPLDELCTTRDDPGLRAAQQLVPRETDEVGAGGEARARGRLVVELLQYAGAEVVDEREPVPMRDARELRDRRLGREADDTEVRLVDAQDNGRLRPDRRLVVGGAGTVRRSDLAQARSRAAEHLGDPEPVPDLDQLAARDEHLAAVGQSGEREQHRSRVVVHDERGLGARQPPEQARDVVLPRPPRAGREVVLEVRVAARGLPNPLERSLRERGSAEVRVDDHARRVDRAPEVRAPERRELGERALGQVARVGAGANLLARAIERGPRRRERERPRLTREAFVPQKLVDRRKLAQLHGESVGAGRS